MNPTSLYIHVPFCTRRCAYCDFAVQATRDPPVQAWLHTLSMEARLLAVDRGWNEPLELETLYIGGGTPSLLGLGAMAALAGKLKPFANWELAGVEWSCEANPESLTPALAEDWRRAGVNRISLGAQSFHPPTLRWMGRLHGAEGTARAMLAARSAGFESVSLDLIFGLPARLGRDWGADLERALELEPDHVSLYGLTAEAGAPLGRWVREGREALADEDQYADEFLRAHERLTAAGFRHYEVSNFAKPGMHSRHNFAYWAGSPYAALGVGAHAFYPPLRRWNLRDWDAYGSSIERGQLPVDGEESVSGADAALERVWLGLRTDLGYPAGEMAHTQRALAERWTQEGLAELGSDALRLTARGWLLLDRLAVDLAAAGEAAEPRSARAIA